MTLFGHVCHQLRSLLTFNTRQDKRGVVVKDNITTQIFKSIQHSVLPDYCKITVVMGSTAF